ncbi:hypothetical protein S58_71660 [Bradyrhizobium oligotrophicum S58]|uniref:Uncharacterized protein n=1 Tax=Bradyrhizobium oligotrophicum S58 TaxID=1245469 RepID=M4ZHL8_9BRAD|nr:hypothetical protein [Bradyrhizobium oligotrophicum]BAM93131.1 hypothetical protein S58_71660 [Bradyrhizobium oligotrophicum S58]
MLLSRNALVVLVIAAAVTTLLGSSRRAAAIDLGFLDRMNPRYRKCVNDVQAQLLPQYRNDRKIHDSIVTACNSRYPAFGR